MIGDINIKPIAHNPSLALPTLNSFVGSPSTITVKDIPPQIGNWRITSLQIRAEYPDNSITVISCVQNGNSFVGTIPKCDIAGTVEKGLTVIANGKDENNNDVTGYVLGIGDIVIADRDGGIIPAGDTGYVMHYLSALPDNPTPGTVMQGDSLSVFNGESWGVYPAADSLTNYLTSITQDITAISA